MSIDRNGERERRGQRAQWAGAVLVGVGLATLPVMGSAMVVVDALMGGVGASRLALLSIPVLIALGAAAVLMHSVLQRPRARAITVWGAAMFSVGAVSQVVSIGLAATPLGYSPLLWVLGLVVGAVGATLCLAAWVRTGTAGGRADTHSEPPPTRGSRVRVVVAISTLACLAMAALVTVDALEWGPRSQTEGLALDEIFARLSEGDVASARAGLAFGLTSAFALCSAPGIMAFVARRWGSVDAARAEIVTTLIAIGGIVVMQTLGGFSLGMSIADTLPPYTGSQSPQWLVFFPAGTLLACLGVTLALGWARVPDAPVQSATGLRTPVPIR